MIHEYNGRRLVISDLIEAGLLAEGDELRWERVRSGESYTAVIAAEEQVQLPDRQLFDSPSLAAMRASKSKAMAG